MNDLIKPAAILVMSGVFIIAFLATFFNILPFVMSFDDTEQTYSIRAWLVRLGVFCVPPLFLVGDAFAFRAFVQGNYRRSLLIAGSLAVTIGVGLFLLTRG